MTLLRSQLIDRLTMKHPKLNRNDVSLSIDRILSAFTTQLELGGRIEIRGFGGFKLNHHSSRRAHNPKTGEKLIVPAKMIAHFKCSRKLLALISEETTNKE